MNTNNPSSRLMFVGMVLFFVLACTLPTPQPVAPPPIAAAASSSTFTPTTTPTVTLTWTPSNIALPALPDFDQMLTFGGGGAGGGRCYPYTTSANTIDFISGTPRNELAFCVAVPGSEFNQTFQLKMIAPDGRTYISPLVSLHGSEMQWDGYPGVYGWAEQVGKLWYLSIAALLPPNFSEGQWQIQVYGNNFLAAGNFPAPSGAEPFLLAVDSRLESQIIPYDSDGLSHPTRSNNHGGVDIIGGNFPANTTIYILLYHFLPNQTAGLVQKFSVMSDPASSVRLELPGPFESNQGYLIIGLTDPTTPLSCSDGTACIGKLPSDRFNIQSGISENSAICSDAPPLRMVVNRRGYVCTQSERVRLRNSPAKSADTIVYVNTGTQFTVISGPSCSDSWSWWNVRLDDGTTGWLAEGGDTVDPYFICPLP